MEVRGGKPPQPQKQKHCNQGKTFLILISSLVTVDTRFVLLFSGIHKKILASVYERSYESSIIPLWKPLLKILAARWFLLLWGFAFEKYERSEFIVAFALALGGVGWVPWTQSHKGNFLT